MSIAGDNLKCITMVRNLLFSSRYEMLRMDSIHKVTFCSQTAYIHREMGILIWCSYLRTILSGTSILYGSRASLYYNLGYVTWYDDHYCITVLYILHLFLIYYVYSAARKSYIYFSDNVFSVDFQFEKHILNSNILKCGVNYFGWYDYICNIRKNDWYTDCVLSC